MASECGRIESLWRYPVRSMRGEVLESAEVTTRGLVGDRCYWVVDVEKQCAAETSYSPRRWGGLLEAEAVFTVSPSATAAPPPVRIRFPDGSQRTSEDPDVADWLSAQLGHPAALSCDADAGGAALADGEAEASGRALDLDDTLEPGGVPSRRYDRSPIHLVTTASLRRAASLHRTGRFEPQRFRPNILLDTGAAEGFVESGWIGRTLAIGPDLRLEICEACERCSLPTLPQADLERDPKIMATLVSHNDNDMGVYARIAQPGTLRCADRVELL